MSDVLVLNADCMPLCHIPLSTIEWQDAIKLVCLGKVRVISEYNNWIVRSQYLEMKVPSIVITTKQVKWRKHLKYSPANVFLRDNFICQLQLTNKCKEKGGKIKPSDVSLDHIVPKSWGGKTTWTNVCTSCKDCNSLKGNDGTILPIKMPTKPSYFEILEKRKKFPIHICDEEWKMYIGWPSELIRLSTSKNKTK